MNTPSITDDLLQEQIRLEQEMRSVTEARYFSNHEKSADRNEFADTHAGRNIMSAVLDTFTAGIEEWCDQFRTGKAGRRPRALHIVWRKLLPYLLAVLLRTFISSVRDLLLRRLLWH